MRGISTEVGDIARPQVFNSVPYIQLMKGYRDIVPVSKLLRWIEAMGLCIYIVVEALTEATEQGLLNMGLNIGSAI